MSSRADRLIEREMGYSQDEFCRVLPAAMRDWAVTGSETSWRVASPDGTDVARLELRPRPARRIGALRIPVLHVRIAFLNEDPEIRHDFLRRFERGFHKGGG